MRRFIAAAIVLAFGLAAPVSTLASIGGHLTVALTFQGSCDAKGYLEVDNTSADFVVVEHQYHWSPSRPIQVLVGSNPIADPGDRLFLRLFAADHTTVLFESDEFVHGGDASAYVSTFQASLDCSSIPYHRLLGDTAIAAPQSFSWFTSAGVIAIVVGLILAAAARPRRRYPSRHGRDRSAF